MLAISSVSAVQNDTQLTNEIDNVDNEIDNVDNEIDIDNEIDNVDNEILGASNEVGTLSDGLHSFEELENEIQTDNLTLVKDYIAHEDEKAIEINHNIEIDGKGHTIDGNGISGIFKVDSLPFSNINIVLKNIVFKNGNNVYRGAALMVNLAENVNVKIINCVFTNNKASEDGGAIYYDSTGGTLEIINSTFEKNMLPGSDFYSSYGGAICTKSGTLTVSNSKFRENMADDVGGAIYIKNSNNAENRIINCLFSQNTAGKQAGAIYTDSKDGGLTVIGSKFVANQVNKIFVSIGGTISSHGGYLSVFNSAFIGNEVANKGAAILAGSKLTINGSSFQSNYAYDRSPGGAIYYDSAEDLKITYSKFIDNKAGVSGGAININQKANIVIEYCEFTSNNVWNLDTTFNGGAIYNYASGTITLRNSKFITNDVDTPESNGGAVYTDSDLVIEDCEFVGNNAKEAGGAVYCGGELTLLGSSTFKDNYVSTDKTGSKATKGGAIYTSTFKSHVGGIFENNRAQYGGAIYI